MLISGSEAMALGAIWAGLKFYSGYPMSPSTPIMEFIASAAKEHRILVEPAEDEISAINDALLRGTLGLAGSGLAVEPDDEE